MAKEYPGSKDFMNIQLNDTGLPDPAQHKDNYTAARTFQNTSPMLKKVEHNYSKAIKDSARKARGVPSNPTRRSAITEIMLMKEQKANINHAGAMLQVPGQQLPMTAYNPNLRNTGSTQFGANNVHKY